MRVSSLPLSCCRRPHTSALNCRPVLHYFRHAPAPLQYLVAPGSGDAAAGGLAPGQLARSALRGLQLLPQLHWPVAALLPALLHHPDSDVRWCVVECAALAFGLQDSSRAQVQGVGGGPGCLAPAP